MSDQVIPVGSLSESYDCQICHNKRPDGLDPSLHCLRYYDFSMHTTADGVNHFFHTNCMPIQARDEGRNTCGACNTVVHAMPSNPGIPLPSTNIRYTLFLDQLYTKCSDTAQKEALEKYSEYYRLVGDNEQIAIAIYAHTLINSTSEDVVKNAATESARNIIASEYSSAGHSRSDLYLDDFREDNEYTRSAISLHEHYIKSMEEHAPLNCKLRAQKAREAILAAPKYRDEPSTKRRARALNATGHIIKKSIKKIHKDEAFKSYQVATAKLQINSNVSDAEKVPITLKSFDNTLPYVSITMPPTQVDRTAKPNSKIPFIISSSIIVVAMTTLAVIVSLMFYTIIAAIIAGSTAFTVTLISMIAIGNKTFTPIRS